MRTSRPARPVGEGSTRTDHERSNTGQGSFRSEPAWSPSSKTTSKCDPRSAARASPGLGGAGVRRRVDLRLHLRRVQVPRPPPPQRPLRSTYKGQDSHGAGRTCPAPLARRSAPCKGPCRLTASGMGPLLGTVGAAGRLPKPPSCVNDVRHREFCCRRVVPRVSAAPTAPWLPSTGSCGRGGSVPTGHRTDRSHPRLHPSRAGCGWSGDHRAARLGGCRSLLRSGRRDRTQHQVVGEVIEELDMATRGDRPAVSVPPLKAS